jgi:predicted nucleotidyltransferase
MSKRTLNGILKEINKQVSLLLGGKLQRIILYGSQARGDAHKWSDVDIMVIADISENELNLYEEKLDIIMSDIGLEYNTVVTSFLNNKQVFENRLKISPFYRNVQREGREVYAI